MYVSSERRRGRLHRGIAQAPKAMSFVPRCAYEFIRGQRSATDRNKPWETGEGIEDHTRILGNRIWAPAWVTAINLIEPNP